MAAEKISVLCVQPGNEIPERYTVGQCPVLNGEWHGEAVVKEIKFFMSSSHFVRFSPLKPIYVVEFENSNARKIIPAELMAEVTTEKLEANQVQQPGPAMFDGPEEAIPAAPAAPILQEGDV